MGGGGALRGREGVERTGEGVERAGEGGKGWLFQYGSAR